MPDPDDRSLQHEGGDTRSRSDSGSKRRNGVRITDQRVILGFLALFALTLLSLRIWLSVPIAEVQAWVQIGAILVAGYWTYFLFVRGRQAYPVSELELKLEHWPIDNDFTALRVQAVVQNKSRVLISLPKAEVDVRQVRPIEEYLRTAITSSAPGALRQGMDPALFVHDRTTVKWPEVGHRASEWPEGATTLEPGETDRFVYDFILLSRIEAVEVVFSLYNDEAGTPECWVRRAIYELGGSMSDESKTSEVNERLVEKSSAKIPGRITEAQNRPERTPEVMQTQSPKESAGDTKVIDPGDKRGQARPPRTPAIPRPQTDAGQNQPPTPTEKKD